MKILIDVNHPAHIHYFRNFIRIMENSGHEFLVITRDMPIMLELLDHYQIAYTVRTKRGRGIHNKFKYVLTSLWIDFKCALKFKPDLLLGFASFFTSFVSFLCRKDCIVFDDTEHNKINHLLYRPFSDLVCTPKCFQKRFPDKHFLFDGYMELTYLHQNYFKPDASIFELLGLSTNENYVIFRFIAWDATHDIGQKGIDIDVKLNMVMTISKYCRVYISSENELPESLKQFQIKIPPERMHDALSFATLFIGEGATMASECAMLGTPAIYLNQLQVGSCSELEKKYGLVYNFTNITGVLEKALEILNDKDVSNRIKFGHRKLMEETIDVTAFMVWLIQNYPDSFNVLKKSSQYHL